MNIYTTNCNCCEYASCSGSCMLDECMADTRNVYYEFSDGREVRIEYDDKKIARVTREMIEILLDEVDRFEQIRKITTEHPKQDDRETVSFYKQICKIVEEK